MRKYTPKRLKHFVRRHRLSLIIISVALVASAGFTYWYHDVKAAEIATTQAETAKKAAETDKKIIVIKAEAAAKKIAADKAATEKKAAEEAAAKEAARLAALQTESTTTAIDAASCNTSATHSNPSALDAIVNKKHCIQPLNFVPSDLVTSRGATLSAKAITGFNNLMTAADAAGQSMSITSSFRSYGDQVSTYSYWVNTSGVAGADTYSARAGYSEHQTGLAFDVSANGCVLDCFGTTSQYGWMQANAAAYGFIQRYYAGSEAITGYKAEEWHYRYVGVAVAQDMVSRGIKTLEQYWGVTGGDYF